MKNESKIEVKFKLDKHRFVRLEVEKEKLPLVRANNREISRNEKRKFGTNPCTLWKHCRREKEMNYRLGWRTRRKKLLRGKRSPSETSGSMLQYAH